MTNLRPVDRARNWSNFAAVLLSVAGTTLSVLLGGLFRTTQHGIMPVLQAQFVEDARWLSEPSAGYESVQVVQWSAVQITGAVVWGVLLCAVLVAVIAFCTLVLTRFTLRRSEFATRAALGAAPAELLRELARPLVRLLLIGGPIGIVLGSTLVLAAVGSWPARVEASSASILLRGGLGGLLCVVFQGGASVGLLWLFTVRRNLADSLRTGERASSSLAETRVRELLTIAQTGACVVLLTVGLALAGRKQQPSGTRVQGADSVAVWSTDPGLQPGASRAQRVAGLERLLQERQSPGISAESLASAGALLGVGLREWLLAECDNCLHMDHALLTIPMHSVGPGYFTLLGNGFVRGRDFAAGDRIDAEPVVIVNDSFVKQMFGPAGSGLGRQVWLQAGMGDAHRIVGVVPDEEGHAPGAVARGQAVIYFAALQHPPAAIDRMARGPTFPTAAVTLLALRASAAAPMRAAALSIQVLVVLCLVLATYGLYATTATLLRGRRRELGVRVALGSTPAGLTRHVAGYGARLVVVGLLAGGWLAFGAQRLLDSALPGAHVAARSLSLMLIAVTSAVLCGAILPALQAGREPPANPLRG